MLRTQEKKGLYLPCPHEDVSLLNCEQLGALHLKVCDAFILFIGCLDPQNVVLFMHPDGFKQGSTQTKCPKNSVRRHLRDII